MDASSSGDSWKPRFWFLALPFDSETLPRRNDGSKFIFKNGFGREILPSCLAFPTFLAV